MITSEGMKEVEREARGFGIEPKLMMENAGRSIVEALMEKIDLKYKRIAVVCGTGNNGGDGLSAARHLLCEGAEVEVFIYGEPKDIKTEEARRNWDIIRNLEVEAKILRTERDIPEFEDFDVLIDAILGTGIEGRLRGFLPQLIEKMNTPDVFKVAVDVPTGLNSDTGEVVNKVFMANLTVTFHDRKPGLKQEFCGEILLKSIGVPV